MNLMHGAFAIGAVAGPLVLGLILATGTVLDHPLPRDRRSSSPSSGSPSRSCPSPGSGAASQRAHRGGTRRRRPRRRPAYCLGFVCLLLYVGRRARHIQLDRRVLRPHLLGRPRLRLRSPSPSSGSASSRGASACRPSTAGSARKPSSSRAPCSSSPPPSALCAWASLRRAAGARPASLWAPAGPHLPRGPGLLDHLPHRDLAGRHILQESQAEAISFAVSGGGVGLFAFPFLMSWISQGYGIRVGFASYALIAALTALSCAALAKVFARQRSAGQGH